MQNKTERKVRQYHRARRQRVRACAALTVLALVVSMGTGLALIKPAATMENTTYCGIEAHIHNEECFEPALICTEENREGHAHTDACWGYPCGLEEREGHTHNEECTSLGCGMTEAHVHTDCVNCTLAEAHTHDESCYEQTSTLICGLDGVEGHEHAAECYAQQQNVVCGKAEIPEHIHSDACKVLVCGQEECEAHSHELCGEMVLICGLEEEEPHFTDHVHDPELCYEDKLICEKEEHEHVDACYVAPVTYCGLEEHFHSEFCVDESGLLVCGMENHVHVDECFVEPVDETVQAVIEMIDQLPEPDELYATAELLCEDEEAYMAYAQEIANIAWPAYYAYEELTEEQKAQVTNFDKLMDSSWLWSIMTLEVPVSAGADGLEPNVYAVDAVNYWNPANTAVDVILLNGDAFGAESGPQFRAISEFVAEYQNKTELTTDETSALDAELRANWTAARVELRGDGDYSVIQLGATANTATQYTQVVSGDGTETWEGSTFLLLIRKSLYTAKGYAITHDWPEKDDHDGHIHTQASDGDSVHISSTTWQTMLEEAPPKEDGKPYFYVTFYPNGSNGLHGDAGEKENDVTTVTSSAIKFNLFNYDKTINKTIEDGTWTWRPLSKYFAFRGDEGIAEVADNVATPDVNETVSLPTAERPIVNGITINTAHDRDGFYRQHATVEWQLDEKGNPILDLTRYADGTPRGDEAAAALTDGQRSLGYLFDPDPETTDPAVTAYAPYNTVLTRVGDHYSFDSALNAVDYDSNENLLRVRGYAERNSSTAGYLGYSDFMPFNYTNGIAVGTTASGNSYQLNSTDVDYWYGMTMEVAFYQTPNGLINAETGEQMVFNFSGDDDVWVFVDDVLVLDLGGTHGTATGSINFATGEIQQYLSWNNGTAANTVAACIEAAKTAKGGAELTEAEIKAAAEKATSFPTTLRACFDAASDAAGTTVTPNGGWASNGQIFTDWSKHTLKFFYMERGSSVANCKLDFTLPTLPDNSLTVAKIVDNPGKIDLNGEDTADVTYGFRVMMDTDKNGTYETPALKAGDTFTLSSGGTGTVAENGIFYLKAGESAVFTGMMGRTYDGGYAYIVEEIDPGTGYTTSYNTGASDTPGTKTDGLSAQESQLVVFTNKVNPGSMSIKKVINRTDGAMPDATAEFRFELKIPAAQAGEYTVTYDGREGKNGTLTFEVPSGEGADPTYAVAQLSLVHDETATIAGLPAGVFVTVTELNTDGYSVKWSNVETVTDETTQTTTETSVDTLANSVTSDIIEPNGTEVLICTNTTGAVLPSTGGMGTTVFYIVGAVLMLGAVVFLVARKKMGKEE